MSGECPTCGRVSPDWTDPGSVKREGGIKTSQRPQLEDRTKRYREWRRTFGRSSYVNDLDQVEWRSDVEGMYPVALIELSRVDGTMKLPMGYLVAAWTRFTTRDPQSDITALIADSLGVPAFFVLFRWDLSEFWVRQFAPVENSYWDTFSPDEYQAWIEAL